MVPPFGVAGSKENFFLLRIKSPAYDTHWPFYIFPTNRQFQGVIGFLYQLGNLWGSRAMQRFGPRPQGKEHWHPSFCYPKFFSS